MSSVTVGQHPWGAVSLCGSNSGAAIMTAPVPYSQRFEIYEATGGEVELDVPFVVAAAADLVVTRLRANAETVLHLTGDYTVAGVNTDACRVVLNTSAQAGDMFLVEGLRTPQRISSFGSNGPFRAADVNAEFNNLTRQMQELRRDVDRAIQKSHFANTWDADGRPIVNLASGATPSSAVTLAQLDAALGGAGPGPAATEAATYPSRSAVLTTHIAESRTYFTTAGYSAPGDGGAALYVRSVSEPIHAGKVQSADGAWWELAEDCVSAVAFGLSLSPAADNTQAVNDALAYSAAKGATIIQPIGTAFYAGELMFPDGARWHAAVPYRSILKKSSGNSNRALVTDNFDDLTGTSDGYADGVPRYIEMTGLVFDGNYMTAARAAYVNTSGGGLFLFARKMKLDLVVQNQAGIGVWSECPAGNPDPLDLGFPPSADVHLRIDTTKEEGLIWKGPVDVELKHVLQWNAGARIADDEFDGAVSSPTYGGTNGGYTDGIVFDRGAEVGLIHAFGNFAGGGITVYGGRINAALLIAESCHFGGIHILGGQGMIDRLDVHRVGGYMGDARPDIFYNANGSGNVGYRINQISNHNISFPSDRGPCNRIVIGDNARWLTCLLWEVKANTRAGHGLVVEAGADFIQMLGGIVHQCQGEADDTLDSTAVLRKSTGNKNVEIEAEVVQCDVVFNSDGTPHNEKIKIRYRIDSDQAPLLGTIRSLPGQIWDISGHVGNGNGNNNWYGSRSDLSFTFDSTINTEQSVTVPHRLIGTPAFGKMQCSLADTDTALNVAVERYFIAAYDGTNITVKYKQASATGANTTPRVWVHAEI